jgi:LytTr DNA-binding domain/GAF domain
MNSVYAYHTTNAAAMTTLRAMYSTTPPDQEVALKTEELRLENLRAYRILDTPPEEAFDGLARLGAYICGTPISMVNLLDADRVFTKAQVGAPGVQNLPRETVFCHHTLFNDDILEVEDASLDPLFRQTPLVASAPNIRYYVGAPLVSPEGFPLGTMCALDVKPHRLDQAQRDALRTLAREVVSHLELRRARLQLEQERLKLDGLLRMANDKAVSLYSAEQREEIFVKQDHRLIRLNTATISYLEALGDYVNIHVGSERYTVYTTMKDMLTRLPARDFVRVHRKYIVRISSIVAIDGDSLVVDGGRASSVPIGNSYKADLMSRLNLV